MTYLPKTINWVENVRFCVYIWWQDELFWKFGGKKMSNFREVGGVRMNYGGAGFRFCLLGAVRLREEGEEKKAF